MTAMAPVAQTPVTYIPGTNTPHAGLTLQDASGNTLVDHGGLPGVLITYGSRGAVNFSVSVSGPTPVTVNSITFTLARSSNVFMWTSALRGILSGGAGTCSMGVQLDGNYPSGASGMGLALQGDVGTNASGTTTLGPFTLTQVWLAVPAGSHTLAVVGTTTGGSTYNCDGLPNFFVLGG